MEGAHPEMLPTLAPDNAELLIRADILRLQAQSRRELLGSLRAALVRVYLERWAAQGDLAYVTADDARVILAATPDLPGLSAMGRRKLNCLGSLFLADGWRPTGQCIHSRTPGGHGNRILCWRWVGVNAVQGTGERPANG